MKAKEFVLKKTRYSCCATKQEPPAFWKQIFIAQEDESLHLAEKQHKNNS